MGITIPKVKIKAPKIATSSTTSFPVGTIMAMLYTKANTPSGWLLCDGKTPVSNGTTLYTLLGGSTQTVYTPNLLGRVLIGAASDSGLQISSGQSELTLTSAQMPCHQHFGWGENFSATHADIGFGYSKNAGYTGSGKSDSDNNLYGSTWAGGCEGTDYGANVIVETSDGSLAFGGHQNNLPVSIMQPSYSINFFIYAGV